jgi:hypothetical protein
VTFLRGGGGGSFADLFVGGGDKVVVEGVTTSTIDTGDEEVEDEDKRTSVHLTFNIKLNVWKLGCLSARRLALHQAHLREVLTGADGQTSRTETRYFGRVTTRGTRLEMTMRKN